MKTISFTEFRNHASDMMTEVEHGETLLVVRHGRPIAEVSPATDQLTIMEASCITLVDKRRRPCIRHTRGA